MTDRALIGQPATDTTRVWDVSALLRLLVLLAAGVAIFIGATLPWEEGRGWWDPDGDGPMEAGTLTIAIPAHRSDAGSLALLGGGLVTIGACLTLASDRSRRAGGIVAALGALAAAVGTFMFVSEPLGLGAAEVPVRTGLGFWVTALMAGIALVIAIDVAQVGRSFRKAPFGTDEDDR